MTYVRQVMVVHLQRLHSQFSQVGFEIGKLFRQLLQVPIVIDLKQASFLTTVCHWRWRFAGIAKQIYSRQL